MNKENIYINRTCRCCLNESDDLLSINNVLETECTKTIAEVLTECTEINPHDDLPQVVCADCIQKAKQAIDFKQMCQQSHIYLRKYFNEQSVIKIESELDIGPELIQVPGFKNDFLDENDILGGNDFPDDNDFPDENVDDNDPHNEDDNEDFRLANNAKKINGRFECEKCGKTLADRRTLILHLRLHLGVNLKKCDICHRGFAKQNHLDRHRVTHFKKRSGEKSKNSMKNGSSSETNIQTTLSKKKKSKECINIKPDIDLIVLEKLEENKSIPIDEEESKLLNSAQEVNGRLQCPLCPKTLSQRRILKLHIRSHVGRNLHRCSICNKGFAKGSNLNRHMLLHRNMCSEDEDRIIKNAFSDGRYSCPYCTKILIDRQTFRLHIRLHISKLFMRCDVCNQAFEDKAKLEEHMTTHGNQFSCNKCGDTFETYHERTLHMSTAHSTEDSAQISDEDFNDGTDNKGGDDINDKYDNDDDEDKQLVERSKLVDGRYECEFCKKTLANRTTLKYHIRLHIQKKLLKCAICGQGFSKKSHLKRHLGTHTKKRQPCRYCDAAFDTYEERKAHTANIHKKALQNQSSKTFIPCWTQSNGLKQCVCLICDQEFDQIHLLSDHIQYHLENPETFSGIDFANKMEMLSKFNNIDYNAENIGEILRNILKQDPQQVSKIYRISNAKGWELALTDSETDDDDGSSATIKSYDCGKCMQSFDRVHRLMCHMKVDHDQHSFKDFKCSYCGQCFPNSVILAKHLRQQCENEDKTIVCSMCNCKFLWQESLERHLMVYHETEKKFIGDISKNVKPFTCTQCSRSFSTESQLKAHEPNHLPRLKRFSCDTCGRNFSRRDNLKSHMRVHLPDELKPVIVKKHLCSFCGRSFSNSSNLTVHIRRHTGERPYNCQYCNASFPRSSDLSCHIRIHTKEKTCTCSVCGRGFTRSNKLVRHMRIHTGERPYKCGQCDRAFTQSNDLTLHLRRHTGEKPFECLICRERFITNSLLQQHRRTSGHIDHHSDGSSTLLANSVNNPHRKWTEDDGKRTGITAQLSLK